MASSARWVRPSGVLEALVDHRPEPPVGRVCFPAAVPPEGVRERRISQGHSRTTTPAVSAKVSASLACTTPTIEVPETRNGTAPKLSSGDGHIDVDPVGHQTLAPRDVTVDRGRRQDPAVVTNGLDGQRVLDATPPSHDAHPAVDSRTGARRAREGVPWADPAVHGGQPVVRGRAHLHAAEGDPHAGRLLGHATDERGSVDGLPVLARHDDELTATRGGVEAAGRGQELPATATASLACGASSWAAGVST